MAYRKVKTIVFVGFSLIILLILGFIAFQVLPLSDKTAANRIAMLEWQQKLELLESEQQSARQNIPSSMELSAVLDSIRVQIERDEVVVEEINLTHLDSQERSSHRQCLIKIRIRGGYHAVGESLQRLLADNPYPLLVEEVELGQGNSQVTLKVLFMKD